MLGLDQPKFVSSSSGVQEQVVAGDCDGTVVSTVETSKAVSPQRSPTSPRHGRPQAWCLPLFVRRPFRLLFQPHVFIGRYISTQP